MKSKIYRFLFIWFGLGLLLLTVYLLFVEWVWPAVYYYIWLLGVGGVFLWRRESIVAAVRRWRAPGWLKFVLLGYGMVMLEEVFAALTNHLSEGFSMPVYFLRIGQFWAFNILAFTGLIFGWYFLSTRVNYTYSEAFFWTGVYGVLAEHGLSTLVSNPMIALVLFPLNFFTYGLILSPALLSVEPDRALRKLSRPLRVALGLGVPFLLALLPVALLMALRTRFPGAFPPLEFIQ